MVVNRTGYPAEMLEMDLDLEADLGIDMEKQAELMSELGERYGLSQDESLQLKDYPTLRHVIGYVTERAGGAASRAATPVQPAVEAESSVAVDCSSVHLRSLAYTLRGRGQKAERSGVTLSDGDHVVIMGDNAGRVDAVASAVRSAGATAVVVPIPTHEANTEALSGRGLIYCDGEVHGLFLAAKAMASTLCEATGFVLASGGGDVAGFCKSLRREWPSASVVKALRLTAPEPTPAQFSDLVMDELSSDEGFAVVHWASGTRWVESLTELDLVLADAPTAERAESEVWVVTGGAQGITAEIVHHMASKRGGVFHLLGRTELPDREPEALPDNEADAKR